jgi:hypothetical protein
MVMATEYHWDMSTAIILIVAALLVFAWRTGRLSAVWAATTGAKVLPGKAT